MSTDLLHSTKISPDASTDADKDADAADIAVPTEDEAEVPTYGELKTTLQTPSPDGGPVPESFEGTQIDLSKSPFPVNNDLFEGQIHMMMRDLPCNTYDFNGEKEVLWELQMQGKFKRQIRGPIYLAMELPQDEKYKVTAPMRIVIKACLQLMKTMGHKDVHQSFGGNGEVPHMGAPAFHSFDRVVVTPAGETPPALGTHLEKQQSDILRRKKFFKTDMKIELGSTYTFSIKNRRFNPLLWKVVGVPIARQFTVSRFTEAVRLAVYEVLEENGKPVEDPKGKLTTMAKKRHTKRNTFLWIHMSRKRT